MNILSMPTRSWRRSHPADCGAGLPCQRLRHAATLMRRGGVIAYPTEAVFGLGCNPLDEQAVRRILAIKQRSIRQGLILIAADFAQLAPFVQTLDAGRMARIQSTWPGPNTWLMPVLATTPHWLTGRFTTLAVRVTDHPLAAALCRAYGGAIVSTSANRHAHAPARTALQVRLGLGDAPDLILSGACGGRARPSVIRDARTGEVLRA